MHNNERTLGQSGLSVPETMPIVFVVDDDVSVRESLDLLIRHAGWQSETYASAQEFLSRAPGASPSCLLLDIEMPGLNGFELQQRLAADRSEMPIIFVTGHGDIPRTVRAMKAGAVEFLTKPFADDKLLQAIQGAIERSREALGEAAELKVLRERYASLTRREREVMTWVVTGLQNKEMAAHLRRSEITIKAHRGKVMQKMQAGSLAELVRMALKLGLTFPPKR
jgi:FixJ family two-component response regulator